ncbi:MAG TPA: SGNH/GDSL hydrolase family protein, partial [Polyangiaceae bacterium]|nr:SGNH/GDSL hydrolase family protein [Polyangiaceae bacterium]
AARVRALAAEGRTKGRRARVFGLVGDSITASPKFMTPLSDPANVTIALEAEQRLAIDDLDVAMSRDGDVATALDVYHGQNAYRGLDSFIAPRAAKVGAQSRWALAGHPAPIDRLITQLSPAVVVVLYGSNDAAVRFGDLDELVQGYVARMSAIVDRLEAAGIVPVLTTVPRHTLDPKRPSCDRKPGDGSNWRIAVQTSAVSAAAAELACARALPLIDLRWALDALPNHGIGPDGVHPNAYRGGSAILDERGLQCGYNVRNYVTLRMLGRLWPLVKGAPPSSPASYP